ncbi:DEAD/DEAH box helicase family protein [Poriferisphaera sp. WC338]|uniref:type I restriction endonuclease subunit R n=1 Tax=Poriferisphaera sp. WC338 TaxID=3425129 RepID=UPI003D81A4FC
MTLQQANQHPEQIARDRIDKMLLDAGWVIQSKEELNVYEADGVIVRELPTSQGPADYVIFIDSKPVGVIEAKKAEEGFHLKQHQAQANKYRNNPIKILQNQESLRFVYLSTGIETIFTDYEDPKPRSRSLYTFHKPETLKKWVAENKTLRSRLHDIPKDLPEGLRDCQFKAIANLEDSFRMAKLYALIQMATGAGKTFTAISFVYRLLKFAKTKRILFLVDTRNLGEQAEQEFKAFQPSDSNKKFTDLYKVQRLTSQYIAPDSNVCISTIQRMYSILKGEELAPEDEETNPAERNTSINKKPIPVAYNSNVPIEQFDFIIIDECHRSIYNLWRQVLDYFDAFQIGLTATPDKRTFGYFKENVVSEYPYEQSVIDGVNVGHDIYRIDTEITKNGAVIKKDEGFVEIREKLTRKQKWDQLDEDTPYTSNQLDKDVVNVSQIRTVIKTFRDRLKTDLFPDRKETPKTLIFAKDDSHADDIIKIVLEEFGEGNKFCKKITYKANDPQQTLAELRNDYYPRIAVTVDMIATGTDVKPLECLLFMRDVRSRNYFEQMKGRGCRTLKSDDLQKISPSAHHGKTTFIIVDAVGVTLSKKTDSRPLERKSQRHVPTNDLLYAITLGNKEEDVFVTAANRLIKLNNQLTDKQKEQFTTISDGATLPTLANDLIAAHDSETIQQTAVEENNLPDGVEPTEEQKQQAQGQLIKHAAKQLTVKVRDFIENARKALNQIMDDQNLDQVHYAGWNQDAQKKDADLREDFKDYCYAHKDEIIALKIFYDQPYRLKDLTLEMVSEVLDRLLADRPYLAPTRIWGAFQRLEDNIPQTPKQQLIALVSLLRHIVGIDAKLTDYDSLVRQRFQDWVFKQHHGDAQKFSEEQMNWLHMIRDHIATSFHLKANDLDDISPFYEKGGLGKFHHLFGNEYQTILDELNERLVA